MVIQVNFWVFDLVRMLFVKNLSNKGVDKEKILMVKFRGNNLLKIF